MRALAACAVAAVSFHSLEALACGCFATTTTVSDPVVQAGERLLFVKEGNQITAYVQIKFQGNASEFGWLVPVPAVPDVKAGTDELFEVLDSATRPQFQLSTSLNPKCRPSNIGFGCGARLASPTANVGGTGGGSEIGPGPLVLRDTAGPYEYAVLKADSQAELTQWLNTNRYFVPVTSDAALKPYIRPGAFFLALKLRSGQTTGDLRPIVLKYTSDYPMIPLILTSATAVPNMGIQVFMLGQGRAIPRNYHHVELNLLRLDWTTAENYAGLVTAAVAEAPEKHAFVTEYANGSEVARGQLNPDNTRFGRRDDLAASPTPEQFVAYLYQHGFTTRGTEDLPDAAMNVLETQIPYPTKLPVPRQQFFKQLSSYLQQSTQANNPDWYAGWPGVSFDATALADAVWTAIAQPILDADALLNGYPFLTRLFTTLSPEDMTKDPVFAINASLPTVNALRSAARQTGCQGVPQTFAAGGYSVPDESRLTQEKKDSMPAAARVEQLSEEGPPVEVSKYELDSMLASMGGGCSVADGAFMLGLAALWLTLRGRKIP
jgi:hypothetical protein